MRIEGKAFGLVEAARHVEIKYGRRVNASSIFRWMTTGILAADGARVRLEYCRIGRKCATDADALARFFEALAEGDRRFYDRPGDAPKPRRRRRSAGQREAAVKDATEKVLAA